MSPPPLAYCGPSRALPFDLRSIVYRFCRDGTLAARHYAVLGVPHGTSRDSIRRAFRGLAAEWHPDVSDDPEAIERFHEIAQAYEVLSRPDARERYDRYGFDPRGVGGFPGSAASADGMFDGCST